MADWIIANTKQYNIKESILNLQNNYSEVLIPNVFFTDVYSKVNFKVTHEVYEY